MSPGYNGKDELASDAEVLPPAATPAPDAVPAPAPTIAKYWEENQQQILKVCMEAKGSSDGPCERTLKARFRDLYFGKSRMEYYHFCQ